jgi:cytoskeletal protein CcmA (bactofilin family)
MIDSRIPIVAALLLVGSSVAAQQVGQTVTRRGAIQEDLYLAGGTVDVTADVQGDVVAAGGRILIRQRVTGDVIVAGGSVDVGAEVLDDVRAAGGSVTLRGRISGDAIATGGTVQLQPDATVGGRAWFGGGEVVVAGRIATHLKAAAERIVISGVVLGDAELTAKKIEILPTARITGTLIYRSPQEARIDPAAEIGGVTRLPVEQLSPIREVVSRVIFLAALAVLGAALILTFPAFALGAVRTLGGEPLKTVGLGVGALVGGPVVASLLMVTVVGLALGIAGLVVYGLALLAGFLTGALYVGDTVLGALRRAPRTVLGAIGALLIGLLAISLAGLIPGVGGLACFALLLFGLGALVLQAYRGWRVWRAASGTLTGAAG